MIKLKVTLRLAYHMHFSSHMQHRRLPQKECLLAVFELLALINVSQLISD